MGARHTETVAATVIEIETEALEDVEANVEEGRAVGRGARDDEDKVEDKAEEKEEEEEARGEAVISFVVFSPSTHPSLI